MPTKTNRPRRGDKTRQTPMTTHRAPSPKTHASAAIREESIILANQARNHKAAFHKAFREARL